LKGKGFDRRLAEKKNQKLEKRFKIPSKIRKRAAPRGGKGKKRKGGNPEKDNASRAPVIAINPNAENRKHKNDRKWLGRDQKYASRCQGTRKTRGLQKGVFLLGVEKNHPRRARTAGCNVGKKK